MREKERKAAEKERRAAEREECRCLQEIEDEKRRKKRRRKSTFDYSDLEFWKAKLLFKTSVRIDVFFIVFCKKVLSYFCDKCRM